MHNRRARVYWVDPRRILPLHELRRGRHFHELVVRMKRFGWQGRPLLCEALSDGRLRPSGHFAGWTGTHRAAAARAAGVRVPIVLVNRGRPTRGRPMVLSTFNDPQRYTLLRSRRDPAAAMMYAELRINRVADAAGVL